MLCAVLPTDWFPRWALKANESYQQALGDPLVRSAPVWSLSHSHGHGGAGKAMSADGTTQNMAAPSGDSWMVLDTFAVCSTLAHPPAQRSAHFLCS